VEGGAAVDVACQIFELAKEKYWTHFSATKVINLAKARKPNPAYFIKSSDKPTILPFSTTKITNEHDKTDFCGVQEA
jgi:hypothetical protein